MYIKNIITENNIITYSMQENNANVVAIESSFGFILLIYIWHTHQLPYNKVLLMLSLFYTFFPFILIIVNKYGHCLGY